MIKKTILDEISTDSFKTQKQVCLRWVNKYLKKTGESITDLEELEDGLKFIKLVEDITCEPIQKYNKNPQTRNQKIDNLKIAIEKIEKIKKIKFINVGAEDIVDKNIQITTEIILSIIFQFSIEEIIEEDFTPKQDILLLWCGKQTQGYANVDVHDFTTSWKDGLAFAAIIHRYSPSSIDFDSLDPKNIKENLEIAFQAAKKIGIEQLLESDDLMIKNPDPKSIMIYLTEIFHHFNVEAKQEKAKKKIPYFIQFIKTTSKLKIKYEQLAQNILNWIANKTQELKSKGFGNSKEEALKSFLEFVRYKKEEKQNILNEMKTLQILYRLIERRLKCNKQPKFIPKGKSVQKVKEKWNILLFEENHREGLFYSKMQLFPKEIHIDSKQQEYLETKRMDFMRKADAFNQYLQKTKKLLSEISGEFEEKLDEIKAINSSLNENKKQINDLIYLEVYLRNQNIVNNPYNSFIAQELNQVYEQLLNYSSKQKEILTNAILESKIRNFDERKIKGRRDLYDYYSGSKGVLDKFSFAKCLKSLDGGSMLNIMKSFIDRLDQSYSGVFEFENFAQLVDSFSFQTESKYQILRLFWFLSQNKLKGLITDNEINLFFSKKDADFLRNHLPKEENDYNYIKWIQSLFSN
ncbi:spectrin beta chain [Anaeramoeba ignava]|uniref:Spectrin beta chain n=1 Tax=Anaeramoeba ignava TaxID=1746090 RepID=A0A9Q0LHQ9_ANAIG|nr:spectrin beta chain [Anaeramoeba ignava]